VSANIKVTIINLASRINNQYIHRKVAEYAEKGYFMFAVDPPKRPADRKDGKHKRPSVSSENKYLITME
jgi:hypothetical protein